MPTFKCYPLSNPDTVWLYCPSYGGAIAFAVLFGLSTTAHCVQASLFRKPFALVLVMGGLWETVGYAFRVLSVRDQLSQSYYTVQQLLIILAPLWINAFVYMLLGRMIHFYLNNDRVFGLRARRVTLMFVLFDITAFLIQATGGTLLNSENPLEIQHVGMDLYMSGVGVQIFFICIFLALAVQFQRLVTREDFFAEISSQNGDCSPEVNHPPKSARDARKFLYVIYGILILIVYRNVYRLVEFSIGIESSITRNEWYTWVFDSMPMLLCLISLNIFHPGQILRGPRCDFSEENRQRKEEKKMKKRAKNIAKDEKKAEVLMKKLQKREAKNVANDERKAELLMKRLQNKEAKKAKKFQASV
jgi:RTA1 like protein